LTALLAFAAAVPAVADAEGAAADDKSSAAEHALLDPVPDTPEAPAFELTAADGSIVRFDDMRGKPVVVNFWATWCPPCRAEMPAMQRAWQQMKGEGILVVAINVGEDQETIEQFTSEVPVDFPLPMDTDSEVVQRWPVRGLPTTFVVDPEGRLVYRAEGERAWDSSEMLDLIRALKR
jgi:peroxiredoxin